VVKISCEVQPLFGAVDKQEVEDAAKVRLLRHRMTRLNASRDEGLKRPKRDIEHARVRAGIIIINEKDEKSGTLEEQY
jgi:hypothetical protein